MRKRLSSKLLALVLSLAICATTVFGCLMSVSAADSCYEFSAATVNKELTEATIDVTFTAPKEVLPNGFIAGAFSINEVNADDADKLTIKSVSCSDVAISIEENYVVFDTATDVESATFKLTFGFSDGTATNAKEYKVQLSEIELAYNDTEYYSENAGAIGIIPIDCDHTITGVGKPFKIDTDNNYSVYKNSECTICGDKFGYQLIPTAQKLNDSDEDADAEGTIDLLEYGDYLKEMGSESTYWDSILADNEETGADWKNAIIIDSAEELAYLCRYAGDETKGKYYKVSADIAGFDLSRGNLDLNGTLAKNLENIKNSGRNHSGYSNKPFQGYFDGNGATVYGAYAYNENTPNAGLFSYTKGDVIIKNINVKLSYMKGSLAAGAIIGRHEAEGTSGNATSLTIENCTVTDCYIESTGTAQYAAIGAIAGYLLDSGGASAAANIKNCFVDLDEEYFVSVAEDGTESIGERTCHGGVVGATNSKNFKVSDCIVLGVTPYSKTNSTIYNDVRHTGLATNYTNVYTDQPTGVVEIGGYSDNVKTQNYTGRVFQFNRDQMQGAAAAANMPNLPWGITWIAGAEGEFPSLAGPDYVIDTIYWNGNTATRIAKGSGTKDDPYIITTADELSYLIGLDGGAPTTPVTKGKYYKIADGIKNIVLQPYAKAVGIMGLNSAAEVKTYFEDGEFIEWTEKAYNESVFCGTFDGNGATVYGLYMVSSNYQGLFSTIDAGATIKNIAVKNSYITSTNYMGAIAATTAENSNGAKNKGVAWIDGCVVANCYMRSIGNVNNSGVVFGGTGNDAVVISNCLVYGNDAYCGTNDSSKVALRGTVANAVNGVDGSALIPKGLVVVTTTDKKNISNTIRNCIVLGTDPVVTPAKQTWRRDDPSCFENVYTDMSGMVSGQITLNGVPVTYDENQVKRIKATDAQGAAAKENLPGLAWSENWYFGDEGDLPEIAAFVTFGADSVSTKAHQLYGSSVTYNDDGTLDFNLHFVPKYEGIKATLYVGTADATKFYKLTATESSYRDDLGDGALMFTLRNISARDIDKIWLNTLVVENGSQKLEWGKTHPIALVDNALGIVEGDYSPADKKVAAALINYADAADDALNIGKNDYKPGVVDLLKDGLDENLADKGETGADWANAIIIDSAEEFAYLCKEAGSETKGKYYKVADGIAGFNLASDKLNINGTLKGHLGVIKNSGKDHTATKEFQGHFDGNGATVYGAWTNHKSGSVGKYAGLFSWAKGQVTIKNINVKMACFTATESVAGIVGYYTGDPFDKDYLTIENCTVTDSHLEITASDKNKIIGGILGYAKNVESYKDDDGKIQYNGGNITIKNCLVNVDPAHYVNNGGSKLVIGGLTGHVNTTKLKISDCISIGIKPYSTWGQDGLVSNHSANAANFSNCYTTEPLGDAVSFEGAAQDFTGKAERLTADQMTGFAASINMPTLDWVGTWATTSGYPILVNANIASNMGSTIYWNGNVATGIANGSGTKDDPYIITTADELAYLIGLDGGAPETPVTKGKYYKIADGIKNIVLQPYDKASDIVGLNSADDVETYFGNGTFKEWIGKGYKESAFCGTFDGNGATVYGLYMESSSYAGLFSTIDAGATIKNIAVKNSYISATSYMGAIAATTANNEKGAKNSGAAWIDGCVVANCYMRSAGAAANTGVVFGGTSYDSIVISNCLVYGNNAYCGTDYSLKVALRGSPFNVVDTDTAITPEGLNVVCSLDTKTNKNLIVNTIRNCIVLGTDPVVTPDTRAWRKNDPACFEYVYTDMPGMVNGEIKVSETDNTPITYTANQVKLIAATDAQGAAAKDNLPRLAWGEKWYVGAEGDYPGFKKATNIPADYQSMIDAVMFVTPDTVGDGAEFNEAGSMIFGVSQTALSLKANPYMSFAFAFYGDYRENRENIKVRFKYTENGKSVTSEEISVPAAVDADGDGKIDDIKNVDGWTNTDKNGKYHTFKADMIPVEALAYGIKVEVNDNNTGWQDFGTYSVEGLGMQFDSLRKTEPGKYYSTRVEAAKALLFYAQAIAARYGAQ